MIRFILLLAITILSSLYAQAATKEALDAFESKIYQQSSKPSMDLSGHDFRNTSGSLAYFNFTGANLRNTNFSGMNLDGTNFSAADLTSADFTGAILIGCNFSRATLDGAEFDGATLERSNFYLSKINNVTFKNTDM